MKKSCKRPRTRRSIAEDDAALRKFFSAILSNFGYAVVEAVDGEDAVAKYRENRDRVQLVILDGIMPKKTERKPTGKSGA